MLLRDIARFLNAVVEGSENIDIVRVAKIEEARDGDITFLANPKYAKFVATTGASAVIVGKSFHATEAEPVRKGLALLRVEDPYTSFLKTLLAFHPPLEPIPPGIHPTAVIDPSASLANDVRVGPYAVIGPQCSLAAGAMICAGVVLGAGVSVGEKTLLYPNVTVREGCRIGARVIIHSGTAVGSDGFGFAPKPDGTYEKIPQFGIVVIEDDVEVGANCTIDRATLGETLIRKGAKLDSLIQVAHNVVIGENTVIAAQTGISGSTKIGKNCMIGGQVGFTGHIEIADGTKVGAQSGVHRSVTVPNTTIFGYPAGPHRETLRMMGGLTHLVETIDAVRALEKRLKEVEEELKVVNSKQQTVNRNQ